jgi:chorismate synthase
MPAADLRSTRSAVLIQNARRASAAALPPLAAPLPPSMCLPTKQQYEKTVEELVKEQ